GSNGRLALAALDDFQVKVRAWWHDGLWPPFSRCPGRKEAGNRSMISCSVVPPVGGWYLVLKVRVRVARQTESCLFLYLSNILSNSVIIISGLNNAFSQWNLPLKHLIIVVG